MTRKNQPKVHNKNYRAMDMDTSILADMDLAMLNKMSRYYQNLQIKIQQKVRQKKLAEDHKKNGKKERAKIKNDLNCLKTLLDSGRDFHQAIESIAGNDELRQNQLAALFKDMIKNNEKWSREARRAAVIRLAQAGLQNGEIAEELGIHRNTVSRDIRKTINQTWNKR